jgi:hypothetical protein
LRASRAMFIVQGPLLSGLAWLSEQNLHGEQRVIFTYGCLL